MNAIDESAARPRRSLILAGGGLKVAFQAGVLEVWLDEAGLEFDHVDAASGGVFNLAMMCMGLTGTQIAENWRNLDPRAGITFNYAQFPKLLYAESLFTLDGFRENVFPAWGLDWDRIRSTALDATFNAVNFSTKEIAVTEPKDMTEQMFLACISLPMWFPPQIIDGATYIDGVYLTDANIEEAIRRGADEVWVIWTVSEKDEWQPGFVANYFQIIETVAIGNYKAILKRIAANNTLIEQGGAGEFGRHIEVKEIKADVPLHYLIDFSRDRIAEAVNSGVEKARSWCHLNGIAVKETARREPNRHLDPTDDSVSFTEEMKGFVTRGETDFDAGFARGKQDGTSLMFHLTIKVNGVGQFVTSPSHDTTDITGYIEAPPFGGRLPLEVGRFNLFVDEADPSKKRMLYRLFFSDDSGQPLTLSGFKVIDDDPGADLWTDTTTLFTSIYKGHLSVEDEARIRSEPDELTRHLIACGKINIYFFDFLKQLTTFRSTAPTLQERAVAMSRFGRLFMGKLWDVYAREVLTSGPF